MRLDLLHGNNTGSHNPHSIFHIGWKKPLIWTRILNISAFFLTAFIFFFIRLDAGKISGIRFDPWFLNMDFDFHYKQVWIYDTLGAVLLGLLLESRWACRNLCFMGALCASGASVSRLIPVVDPEKCNLCGKCVESCRLKALKIKFIWNRKKYIISTNS